MKIVILAAGFGTRLYPLTLEKPKALLEIKGKPLIDYVIEKIPENNEIIVVSSGKFYDNFLEWNKRHKNKLKIIDDKTQKNEERLGGIGDLWLAIKEEKIDDDILIILGDNFFGFEISDFIKDFEENKEIMLGVYETNKEHAKKFGVANIDKEGNLIEIEEKPKNPKTNLIITGLYAIPKEKITNIEEYIKSNKNREGITYLIKDLMNKEKIKVHKFIGKWYDIGSLEDYNKLKNE